MTNSKDNCCEACVSEGSKGESTSCCDINCPYHEKKVKKVAKKVLKKWSKTFKDLGDNPEEECKHLNGAGYRFINDNCLSCGADLTSSNTPTLSPEIDELVRDLTSVANFPKTKSEVKRKILQFLASKLCTKDSKLCKINPNYAKKGEKWRKAYQLGVEEECKLCVEKLAEREKDIEERVMIFANETEHFFKKAERQRITDILEKMKVEIDCAIEDLGYHDKNCTGCDYNNALTQAIKEIAK